MIIRTGRRRHARTVTSIDVVRGQLLVMEIMDLYGKDPVGVKAFMSVFSVSDELRLTSQFHAVCERGMGAKVQKCCHHGAVY